MILGELSIGKILIVCEDCNKQWESSKYNQQLGIKKYGRDLCRGCKQRAQIKTGIRGSQYKNAGEAFAEKYKGKKLEEIVGVQKAKQIKENFSINRRGEKNANFGGCWHGENPGKLQKGKTKEEIYGVERALIIKNKISKSVSGEKNGMFGKPSPQGSGNGWSGWYKGWFFRSLIELSFMINVIERFKFSWKSGENRKYMVSYSDYDGILKNYFSDFILNNEYMVEIKPNKLKKSKRVILKQNAATKFCEENGLKYKLFSPVKTLSYNDIKILISQNKIEFTDKYKEKFKLWQEEN